MDFAYRDQWALVTGASSGIGEAFARALAARGMHLLLTARRRERLQALADELAARHGVETRALPADLAAAAGVEALIADVGAAQVPVHLLVNNAGFGSYGRFETLPPEREQAQVQVNCASLVRLAHAFLPAMQQRGAGAVVNLASTAAFQPTPGMAVYGATKAFVLHFSEALWAENRARGVRVLALCPGGTRTEFFAALNDPSMQHHLPQARMMSAERVVAQALRALERGRSYKVNGALNYLGAVSTRLGPRALVARVAARVMAVR